MTATYNAVYDERANFFASPIISLFHPRKQNCFEHFKPNNDDSLIPLTNEGAATIKLSELNQYQKVEERKEMIKAGFYPR